MSIKKYKESINELIRLKDKPKYHKIIKIVNDHIELQSGIHSDENIQSLQLAFHTLSEEAKELLKNLIKDNWSVIKLIKQDMKENRPER